MKNRSKVEKTIGFKWHAVSLAIGLPLLVVINVWTGPPYWVLWSLLGWGLGLATHWWFVLGPGSTLRRLPSSVPGSAR
jgi:hypothetical protein